MRFELDLSSDELYFLEQLLDGQRELLNRRLIELAATTKEHELADNFKQLVLGQLSELQKSVEVTDSLRFKIENLRKGGLSGKAKND
jgi:hypothetical protein